MAYQKVNLAQAIQKGNNERKESAREFLQALPTMPSHYCRSSSNKNYLEPLFASKSEVYCEYKTQCTENGKAPYHKTGFTKLFHELNLSLYQPKKDQCDTSVMYVTQQTPVFDTVLSQLILETENIFSHHNDHFWTPYAHTLKKSRQVFIISWKMAFFRYVIYDQQRRYSHADCRCALKSFKVLMV